MLAFGIVKESLRLLKHDCVSEYTICIFNQLNILNDVNNFNNIIQ